MNDHESETAFLKKCLLYDRSAEPQELLATIGELESNERCVRRAVGLMMFLVALALVGLGYAAILLTDYPTTPSLFIAPLTVKIFAVLSVASLICLLVFAGLALLYRRELNHQREKGRRLIADFLECQLGKIDLPAVAEATKGKLGLDPLALPVPPATSAP
jgi:hypothetical protein